MRKKILGIVFMGALLLGAALPGTALAGHDRGNGTSADTNVAVCHKGRTIHVNGGAATLAAHTGHGDTIGACAV